jgi:hypothetical protein
MGRGSDLNCLGVLQIGATTKRAVTQPLTTYGQISSVMSTVSLPYASKIVE